MSATNLPSWNSQFLHSHRLFSGIATKTWQTQKPWNLDISFLLTVWNRINWWNSKIQEELWERKKSFRIPLVERAAKVGPYQFWIGLQLHLPGIFALSYPSIFLFSAIGKRGLTTWNIPRSKPEISQGVSPWTFKPGDDSFAIQNHGHSQGTTQPPNSQEIRVMADQNPGVFFSFMVGDEFLLMATRNPAITSWGW